MVLLDKNKRSSKYIFWKRTLSSLIVFFFVYLGCLKPLQIHLVKNILFQPLNNFIIDKQNIELIIVDDEMRIINKQKNQESKIEFPLNGSILFALILFYISKNKTFLKLLIKYQIVWILIIPFACIAIIYDNSIIAIVYDIHLKLYKIIFLFLGILSVKQFYLSSYNKIKIH